MARITTKERVWDFLNSYYSKHGTTPSIGEILEGIGIERVTGRKRDKLRNAIKSLEREGYIRTSMRGRNKFIVLLRMGRYTG